MTTSNDTTLYCIYRIVNSLTGDVYVGQTRDIKNRIGQHLSKLKRGVHHSNRLQCAYNEYGQKTFYFEILEQDILSTDIDEREIYWISYFNSYKEGYNNTLGGSGRDGHGISCTWNGIEYSNKTTAARANGISVSSMCHRLANGYQCDVDMSLTNQNSPCIWNGIEYPSISHAARALKINKTTMQERLQNGYTCDNDISTRNLDKVTVWNGVEYPSQSHAARAVGVTSAAMLDRLARGLTCDSEIAYPTRSKICVWEGIVYPSIRAAAKANGMPSSTMSTLIKRKSKGNNG